MRSDIITTPLYCAAALAVVAALAACSAPSVHDRMQVVDGPVAAATDGGGAEATLPWLPPRTDASAATVVVDDPDAAACSEESFGAQQVPLDLQLVVDTSGSMSAAIIPEGTPAVAKPAATRWSAVREALLDFFDEPKST